MRVYGLLWLCVALAAQTATVEADPATWPDRGPYQKVGNPDSGLGPTKMPVPVVAAVQRLVPNDPSHWNLYPGLHDFAGHGWRILQLYGGSVDYVTLLLARGSWTILSVPASLPVLNEVLDPLNAADLQNRDKTESYLWHVVLLQRHGQGGFLDEEFRRENVDTPRYKLWLRGTETRREALRALCHDPVLTRSGDRVTARVNVMTANGAVEGWTFHLQVGQSVQLKGTEVRLVRKEHTFFYPLM